jgi:hypothetical protein
MVSSEARLRRDQSGDWLPMQFVAEVEILMGAGIYNYAEPALESIANVELAILHAMESSKHWCKANKQFKDE